MNNTKYKVKAAVLAVLILGILGFLLVSFIKQPKTPDALFTLAQEEYKKGRYDSALTRIEKLQRDGRLGGKETQALLLVYDIKMQKRDEKGARAAAEKAAASLTGGRDADEKINYAGYTPTPYKGGAKVNMGSMAQSGFKGAQALALSGKTFTHFEAISGIKTLKQIDFSMCGIQDNDLNALSELTELEYLDLHNNKITDIKPLVKLTNLRYLNLSRNKVTDMSPLAQLPNLEYLNISGCGTADISKISEAGNMRELYLGNNKIEDISALSNMPELLTLELQNNKLTNLSPIENAFPKLGRLNLSGNKITDLSPLGTPQFLGLEHLALDGNPVSDLTPLSRLFMLRELSFANCKVEDISPLKNLYNLTKVNLSGNPVEDTSVLDALPNLSK